MPQLTHEAMSTDDVPDSQTSDSPDDEPDSLDSPAPVALPIDAGSNAFQIDMSIEVDQPDPPLDGWLDIQLHRIAVAAGIQGLLSLAIVDDDVMAELHEQHMNIPGTTDVLTFDLREDNTTDAANTNALTDRVNGEIVICLDEATRQATERGIEPRLEVLLYAVHGLLHLQGYDDHDEDDYAAMHKRENELLSAAGFGPVFGEIVRRDPDTHGSPLNDARHESPERDN